MIHSQCDRFSGNTISCIPSSGDTITSSQSSMSTIQTNMPVNNNILSKNTSKNTHKNQNHQNIHKIDHHIASTKQQTLNTVQSTQSIPPFTDHRRWRKIGGNVLQLLRNPPQTPNWNPTTHLPLENHTTHPFGQLLKTHYLSIIPHYCQGNSVTIIRSIHNHEMHITTNDLRDIISPNRPIYHENLVLSLELLCNQFEGSYMDPSFYPTLRDQGWPHIKRRFASTLQCSSISKPSFESPTIAIPIHVNGDHWIALCRRVINGITYFFYADDMNRTNIECTIKNHIFKHTDTSFCPPTAQWITCRTPTFTPHQNECGPRTI
jgi:hypothetical protein